ncbi:MAG: DUF1800 domain-containing protein [Alphaproteobacteria bacterium]|nr:DUF1800 domain-containing protein [Alphaproteobacteria bacterium]
MSAAALRAAARFGLGARPGELAAIATDPRGWALAQIERAPAMPAALAGLASGAQAAAEFSRQRRRGDAAVQQHLRQSARAAYLDEAGRRTLGQVQTAQPLAERLVAFWSNHFTVSVQRPVVLALAGPFEREAIRPHVLGRFRDMLLAVARHPAMLGYLDQAISIGPNSRAGQRRQRGLNENLAREILELHTLGVDGGYGQADVTQFARILTGWSIGRDQDDRPGDFMFRPMIHEPGEKTLLGRRFAEAGEDEGIVALSMLAGHRATARHVATKLARHFIADRPPPGVVERLAQVFLATDGDLRAVTRALVDAPEAWTSDATKVKTPNEFVVSALRAAGVEPEPPRLLPALQLLGQPPFAAPSPAGWPDTADQWLGPEAVIRRAEWAAAFATRLGRSREPAELLAAALGDGARPETRLAVQRAASVGDAIAIVLASPEFQRR